MKGAVGKLQNWQLWKFNYLLLYFLHHKPATLHLIKKDNVFIIKFKLFFLSRCKREIFGHALITINFHYFIPWEKIFVKLWGLVGHTEISQHYHICSQCILIYYQAQATV